MNTTDNNEEQELKELKEKRDMFGKQLAISSGAIGALCLVVLFAASKLDDNSIVYSLIGISFIFVLSAFVISLFKYRKVYDAVVSEKRALGIPVKEAPTRRFYSTLHPTWNEKSGKFLGIAICVIAILLIVVGISDRLGVIHYNLPQLFKDNYTKVAAGMVFIGLSMVKYRPDLCLLSRSLLWPASILILISLPLYFMGYEIGDWMMCLAWFLGIISILRIEKEVYFLELDE